MTKDTLISDFAATCLAMQELAQKITVDANNFFGTHPDHISKRQLSELEKAYIMAKGVVWQLKKSKEIKQ